MWFGSQRGSFGDCVTIGKSPNSSELWPLYRTVIRIQLDNTRGSVCVVVGGAVEPTHSFLPLPLLLSPSLCLGEVLDCVLGEAASLERLWLMRCSLEQGFKSFFSLCSGALLFPRPLSHFSRWGLSLCVTADILKMTRCLIWDRMCLGIFTCMCTAFFWVDLHRGALAVGHSEPPGTQTALSSNQGKGGIHLGPLSHGELQHLTESCSIFLARCLPIVPGFCLASIKLTISWLTTCVQSPNLPPSNPTCLQTENDISSANGTHIVNIYFMCLAGSWAPCMSFTHLLTVSLCETDLIVFLPSCRNMTGFPYTGTRFPKLSLLADQLRGFTLWMIFMTAVM